MTALAFLDTETTGLDPDLHEIWEVALILRDSEGIECEYVWQLPVDLGRADPIALNIGRFHERRWTGSGHVANDDEFVLGQAVVEPEDMPKWCALFADLTIGAHLVGAVVSFDEERLRRLLRRHGQCPMWHYHLIDVEGLAAGYIAGRHRGLSLEGPTDDRAVLARPPWNSEDLSRAVGIDPDRFDRHTALGDAMWARAIYDQVVATP